MKHEKSYQRVDQKLSGVSAELTACIKQMLTFSPESRAEAKDILKSQYFNDIRSKRQEKAADFKIQMPLEHDGCYDYTEFVDHVPQEKLFKEIQNEILLIKKLKSPLRPNKKG